MTTTHKTLSLQCPHCDCRKDLWVEILEDRIEPFFCCRAYDVDIRDGVVTAWRERRIRAGRRIPESQAIVCEEDWHRQFQAVFANYDGPGSPIGTGKDAQEAIRDLLDQVEE